MTLTANQALVLPSNYVSINETEMEYVDGGWYLNNSQCQAIMLALGVTATASPAAVATLITTVGSGALTAMLAPIPVIGLIVSGYGAWCLINSAESFSSSLCTAVWYGKGVEISVGFRWFSPYIKSDVK